MKNKLVQIANYMTNRYEGKKHGGYNIYQDSKIKISYDTYYPNVEVHINKDGLWKLVALYNGHGITQAYLSGQWVNYVDELYPQAVENEILYRKEQARIKKEEEKAKFSSIDDSEVFKD